MKIWRDSHRLNATAHNGSIPKDIDEKLQFWALEFNKELDDEKLTANRFKASSLGL